MRKTAVLLVRVLFYASPIFAETPEIKEARIATEADAQADAKRGKNQLLGCLGSSTLVTLPAVGGAFYGCLIGDALKSPPSEGMLFPGIFTTGVVCCGLTGWGIGFAGSLYGLYKLGGKVPSERLIGKSPEYIEVYTATYKQRVGIHRARRAAGGSAILHGLLLILAIGDI